MHITDIMIIAGIGILGFLCQWLAWRTKKPAILYLLIVGILIGPGLGVLQPDKLFGDLLFPFVSLAVAVILFEGSLTLKRKELNNIGPLVWKLVTTGAILNAVIVTLAAHYLAGFQWQLAALFGAIMVVTGPTVIMPLLRAVRPNLVLSRTLRWEGIIIDPLGALFAVLVFEWIVVQQTNADFTQVLMVFVQTILAGSIIGIILAYPFGLLLRNYWIPKYLHNFATISFVIGAFVISNGLMHESGLLAVTIMGIWLANMKGVDTRDILEFKESLTVIFVSALFILLAARINVDNLQQLGWGAIGVLLVMQFIARPIKVWFCSLGSALSIRERALLAWVGPRGIVAAAVSALFALRLEQLNVPQSELLVPLSFSIIVGTVVIQSLTSRRIASWLGVIQPKAKGYLIIGANPVAIALAKALKEADADSLLCDDYWENIKNARMAGLNTYYGNPMSDHAEVPIENANLSGMLGLSHYHERNLASSLRFKDDFGSRKVFSLASQSEQKNSDKYQISAEHKGHTLFAEDMTYSKLLKRIHHGDHIHKTPLSNEFTYDAWKKKNENLEAIPLFFTDTKGKVLWITDASEHKPQANWNIYALTNKIKSNLEKDNKA